MSIISYAQNFEDVMLWRALGHIERGFYIDIGAQDPTIDSVSRAFHEHGWHGIHVEPTPHYAELLRQQRPGDTVIQAAVGNGPALSRFYEVPNTGISTADAGIANQHRERGFDVQEIIVTFVALSAIFENCAGEIHWLKIDVEGFEHQVLTSWGASEARPWIVVVESTQPLTQIECHQSWESKLTSYGYTSVYFDGLNRYYISDNHPELKTAFASPPNIFDGFTLNGTASAPFHQLIDARCKENISETEKHVAERALSRSQQERALRGQYAEREQSLHQNLQTLQEQLDRLQQERAAREQTLHKQNSQCRQELESLLRQLVQREQQVRTQLLTIMQQADQEKGELALRHSEREQALLQKLQASQEQQDQLQRERVTREQLLHEQNSQSRQELESLLRQLVLREQEIAVQMLVRQQQAEQEKIDLARYHSEQEYAVQRQCAERQQALAQQLKAGQETLVALARDWTQNEKALSKEISGLQHEVQALHHAKQLLLQQHDAELSTKLAEHQRMLVACAALESELKAEALLEQQASLRLRQSLAEVQRNLDLAHASLSWRMTAPLRKLADLFNTRENQTPAPISLSDPLAPEPDMPVATEAPPIAVTQASFEPTMTPLTQPTATKMTAIASTLPELLACHDQQFVCCAYQTLLGREPDPEGLGYYLGRLRMGFSKIQILAQLRLSNEGKTYAAKLPGLDTAIQHHKKEKYSFIGWLFGRRNGGEGDHSTERKLRGIENQLFLLSDESNSRFNQLETALDALRDLVVQQNQSLDAALGRAPLVVPDAASINPIQPPDPDGLTQLAPRAKDIYFQLKKMIAIQTGSSV